MKDLLNLKDAAADPRCPFDTVQRLRSLIELARPMVDSSGRVVAEGDPEIASCFIQPVPRGHILVNLPQLLDVLSRRTMVAEASRPVRYRQKPGHRAGARARAAVATASVAIP